MKNIPQKYVLKERFPLRMSNVLHRATVRAARSVGMSTAAFIRLAVEEKIERMQKSEKKD